MGRASEALGKQADPIASYERALVVDISFLDLSKRVRSSPRDAAVSFQTAPVTLADLQRGVRLRLDGCSRSSAALWRRFRSDQRGELAPVSDAGQMFRPTLLLLAEEATGGHDPRATALRRSRADPPATLVHDDSVDHVGSAARMPTITRCFIHQISVIMATIYIHVP